MSFTFSRTDTIELRICLSAREFIAFSNFSKLWPYGGIAIDERLRGYTPKVVEQPKVIKTFDYIRK
jgi:hypothetical protein